MGRASKWLLRAKTFVSLKASRRPKGIIHSAANENTVDHDQEVDHPDREIPQPIPEKADVIAPTVPVPEPESTLPTPVQEELAAVKIQAAFRGAMARKKVKGMRAVTRIKSMLHERATRKQTSQAFRCMQSFAKLQSQVRIQRARLNEFQVQRKEQLEKEEASKLTEEDDWDDSIWSKEQILAKIENKQKAAVKRERTLAYAFSHQLWRSYPKDLTPVTNDGDGKSAWSWSWLEQWMSTRTWSSLEDGKVTMIDNNPIKKSPLLIKIPLKKHPAISSKVVDVQQQKSSRKLSGPVHSKLALHTGNEKAPAQVKSAKVHNNEDTASDPAKSVPATLSPPKANGTSEKPSSTKTEENNIGDFPPASPTPRPGTKKNKTMRIPRNDVVAARSPARSPILLPHRSPRRIS